MLKNCVKIRLARDHWIWQLGDCSETKFFQEERVVTREQWIEDKTDDEGKTKCPPLVQKVWNWSESINQPSLSRDTIYIACAT